VGLVLKLKLALVTAYLCRAKYFRRCSFCWRNSWMENQKRSVAVFARTLHWFLSLIHMCPVHTPLSYFIKIHFNIILPVTPWSFKSCVALGLPDQNFVRTGCTHANNSHVETVKYLMNKTYGILILMNIKNCT
jgi:hypothetical protein